MKECDQKRCGVCVYSKLISFTSKEVYCDYMYMTGERRGCPAGKGCKRWIPAPKKEKD